MQQSSWKWGKPSKLRSTDVVRNGWDFLWERLGAGDFLLMFSLIDGAGDFGIVGLLYRRKGFLMVFEGLFILKAI